jgi:Mrp family chromosome partitioning ATPase
MVELRDTLAQSYDVILIDSPTFLAAADGAILASLVDGVLLVLRLGRVRRETMATILDQLAHLSVQPVGLVLNHSPNGGTRFDYRPVARARARDTRRSGVDSPRGVSPQSAAWAASEAVGEDGADV